MLPRLLRPILGCLALCGLLAGSAGAEDGGAGMTRAQAYARARALTALGQRIFFDKTLSASGQMACATCHDPDHGFGPANALDVPRGGKDMRQPGLRAVPSLTYLQAVPQFTEHYYDSEDEGDASIDNGPTGGLTWDGRVDRHRDQARAPLLSPYEMANETPGELAARLRRASYAAEVVSLFGSAVFDDGERAVAAVGEALAAYQQQANLFYPYSSKYDDYLAGRTRLSTQEARGLALFNDPAKGNCASCHRSARAANETPPQFTDFGLIALGVPRNRSIPANADARYFDLGICGPLRRDLAGRADYCGLFRTPSLRNVALRTTFFHNGLVHSLREAVAFYVERDTMPGKWYPRDRHGRTLKFDDLPATYRANINTDPPFGGKDGDPPALGPAEIDDVTAFLTTLTDRPARASGRPRTRGQGAM
jgi:cytochrome c peroxidase